MASPLTKDPSIILKQIMSIIARDVRKIKRETKDAKLEPEEALTLSRYASILTGVIEEEEEQKTNALKKFKKMSTDELVNLYLTEKKKNKPKKETGT